LTSRPLALKSQIKKPDSRIPYCLFLYILQSRLSNPES